VGLACCRHLSHHLALPGFSFPASRMRGDCPLMSCQLALVSINAFSDLERLVIISCLVVFIGYVSGGWMLVLRSSGGANYSLLGSQNGL
jgi:hypothetical protein